MFERIMKFELRWERQLSCFAAKTTEAATRGVL